MATTTAKKVDFGQYTRLQQQLKSSPTAYARGIAPSSSDLKAEAQFLQLQKAKRTEDIAQMRENIYGAQPLEEKPKKPGIFQRFLGVLGAPLRLETKLVGKALGRQNISNYGDLLRSFNVNKWVAMPLGIALDIAGDPINWLTLGTAATIPKLVKGVTKGGVAGLAAAGKSAALSKAAMATRIAGAVTPKILGGKKVVAAAGKLRSAAAGAESAFREASGLPSVIEEVTTPGLRKKFGELTAKALRRLPQAEKFAYSTEARRAAVKAGDIARRGEVAAGTRTTLDDFIDLLENRRRKILSADPEGKSLSAQLIRENMAREREGAANIIKTTQLDPPNPNELLNKSAKATADDLAREVNNIGRGNTTINQNIRRNRDETGIKWFDNLRAKIFAQEVDDAGNPVFLERTVKQLENGRTVEVTKNVPKYVRPKIAKVGNIIQEALELFKWEKVPGNPLVALPRSVVGNLGFTGMVGINVFNPKWLQMVRAALKIGGGKQVNEEIRQLIEGSKELRQYLRDFPDLAKEIGLSDDLLEESLYRTAAVRLGKEAKILEQKAAAVGKAGAPEINKEMAAALKRLQQLTEPRAAENIGTSFFSQEIMTGPFGQRMEEWAKSPTRIKRLISQLVEKTTRAYDASDQTFKIGTTLHLHLNGVTEKELQKIGQYVRLEPNEIKQVGGLFKFTPEAAQRVADTAYMNYAAMPAFVRMIRQIPVLGSPFVSFSYAMLPKIGQTLLYNPAIFNKINFTLDEIGRVNPPGPLEKAAIAGPYYNFLGSGDWTKSPFWAEYPLYVGIGKWLPYLSLNYFEPSERKYSTKLGSAIGGTIDKMPIMKDPIGQFLFDYVIQPWMLNESQPTGVFGQPLFRQSDTALARMGRAGMGLAEAFVPPWFPPGYRARQLMTAFQQKTPQGIPSEKSRWDLLMKALAGQLGISLTDVDLQNQAAAVQRTIREATKKTKKK